MPDENPIDTGPRYQHLPDLSPDDRRRLKDSIAEHGVLVPIDVDEEGRVLDGHNRLMIAAELGQSDPPRRVLAGLSEEQKRYHANAVNLLRRHLDREAKLAAIRSWLREAPQDSNASVAEALGVDDHVVAARRREMEETSEIPRYRATGGRGVTTGELAEDAPLAGPPTRDDPPERTPVEDAADHRQMCYFEYTFGYPAPSATERQRSSLPYVREKERREWYSGRTYLTSPVPTDAAGVVAATTEAANTIVREICVRRPLATMRGTA